MCSPDSANVYRGQSCSSSKAAAAECCILGTSGDASDGRQLLARCIYTTQYGTSPTQPLVLQLSWHTNGFHPMCWPCMAPVLCLSGSSIHYEQGHGSAVACDPRQHDTGHLMPGQVGSRRSDRAAAASSSHSQPAELAGAGQHLLPSKVHTPYNI